MRWLWCTGCTHSRVSGRRGSIRAASKSQSSPSTSEPSQGTSVIQIRPVGRGELVLGCGFGSGLNVLFYPAAVTAVTAVEPSEVGWKLAGKRLRAARIPVDRSGLDGQSLPFAATC